MYCTCPTFLEWGKSFNLFVVYCGMKIARIHVQYGKQTWHNVGANLDGDSS